MLNVFYPMLKSEAREHCKRLHLQLQYAMLQKTVFFLCRKEASFSDQVYLKTVLCIEQNVSVWQLRLT